MPLASSRSRVFAIAPAIALSTLASSACHKVWRVKTFQPPPLLGQSLEARTSLPAVITVRDMELPRWVELDNSAYFVVVSKDRVRVHVSLRHKWEDFSDPRRWRVRMLDSLGRRFDPDSIDGRNVRPVTSMYQRGYETSVNDLPLFAVTFFRGDGDYVFHKTDLFRRDVEWILLILERPGYEYRYLWSFVAHPSEASEATIAASVARLDGDG